MLYGAAECSRDLDLGPVAPLRVDIMSLMRAVAPFAEIWERHTTIALPDPSSQAAVLVDLLSLGDLVNANRTQRDKDWPMLRRLVDASHASAREAEVSEEQVDFWLAMLRSPEFLRDAVAQFPDQALNVACPDLPQPLPLNEAVGIWPVAPHRIHGDGHSPHCLAAYA